MRGRTSDPSRVNFVPTAHSNFPVIIYEANFREKLTKNF